MTIKEAIRELEEDKAMYMPREWIEELDRDTPDGRLITALEVAIQSLEAWEKVREDLRKFIDANSNSGDMYLDGRADGGWHALATIKRCLAEIENDK